MEASTTVAVKSTAESASRRMCFILFSWGCCCYNIEVLIKDELDY